MAVDIERSCSGIPTSALDSEEEANLLGDVARTGNGGRNVWTEGLKLMLIPLCKPRELGRIIEPLGNEQMLALVHALEGCKTFVITPDIVSEAGIPSNFPS